MHSSAHRMLQIAKVLKSNGTEGEVVISFRGISPEDIDPEGPVFIYFDGLPVPFYFDSLVRKGNNRAIARLTGIESLEDADEIVGADIYADGESLGMEEYEEDDLSFLTGWTLMDKEGDIKGVVSGYLDIPENPCLEINTGNGDDVIVPLHEDLVDGFDENARTIRMNIPDGLFPEKSGM